MGFHDVRLPITENLGPEGGPGFDTSALTLGSGQTRIILRNSVALSRFEASYEAKTHADVSAIRSFYLARSGSVHSFRYKAWGDYNSSKIGHNVGGHGQAHDIQDQVLSNGVEQTIQLIKRYSDDEGSYVKNIVLPVAGTVRIGVDDGLGAFTELVEGVDFSVSSTTGIVMLTNAPTEISTVYGGFEYDHHVRFSPALDAEKFNQSIDTFGSGSIGSLPLEEVADGLPVRDMVDRGGQHPPQQVGSPGLILSYSAFCWPIEPTVSLPVIKLPPIEYADPTGGPWFMVVNTSGVYVLQIVTFGDVVMATIQPGSGAIVTSIANDGGATFWAVMS